MKTDRFVPFGIPQSESSYCFDSGHFLTKTVTISSWVLGPDDYLRKNYTLLGPRSFAERSSETEEFDQNASTCAEIRARKPSHAGNREKKRRYLCHHHVTFDGMAPAWGSDTLLEPLLLSAVVR